MKLTFASFLLCTVAVLTGTAQTAYAELPLKAERTLTLNPERTTWTSLDVSPDGKTLIFDVLGDLYVMPSKGGKARQISQGLAFDSQPRFSPDGKWITFTSDRNGSENVWIARPDGSDARVITGFDDDTALASPSWSADGKSVFASRFRPDLNNYELWQFPLSGAPALIAPIKPDAGAPRPQWRSTLDVTVSPDGHYVYYGRRTEGLEFDTPTRWTILRRDLATGEELPVITGSGGRGTKEETFFAPRIAPDGRHLAYATRVEGRTYLRVRDLDTGADKAFGETELDALQASSWQGLIPGLAFTPDSKAIILSHGGRFERRDLSTGASTTLHRDLTARVDVAPSTRIALNEETGPVQGKLAMSPATSPDGRRIAFGMLGAIWVQDIASGTALRLTADLPVPAQPAWSPDGKSLVTVTWTEAGGSEIWLVSSDGSEPPRKIDAAPAYYRFPVFSPDGNRLLVLRSSLEERRQTNFEFGLLRQSQLVEVDPLSGNLRIIAEGNLGGRPHFVSSDPSGVYLPAAGGLVRISLTDGAATPVAHITGPGWYFAEGNADADDLRISPDGKLIAATIADRLYVLPRPAEPSAEVDVLASGSTAHILPRLGADWFEWSGPDRIDTTNGTLFSRLETSTGKELSSARLSASLPRAVPSGSILLRGAHVLTMADGDKVLENADILISGDRIAAIGTAGTLNAPAGTEIRNVSGKTVVPGLIDDHDHIGEIRRNNFALEQWGLRARLAYGVTTSLDPSTLSIDHIGYEGLVDAGLMLSPRLRSTGPAVFSKQRIASLDDARRVVSRYADGYRIRNLKEYRTGDREVRQWLAMAIREKGMLPTTEGALSLKLDLTQILDGYAGNEHALSAPAIGDDLIEVMKAMRTSYVTTLSITNSGSPAMDWFIAHDDPVVDDKLRRFWPQSAISQKLTIGREFHPLAVTRFPRIAADAAHLANEGGLVGMGSHGEAPGIGFHWEMEAHVVGGMTPEAVLHAATAGAAETIGRLNDLGTLEVGKLADLLILDADPREDIRNARKIAAVMRGGFLFEGSTLAPMWPEAGPAPKAWFDGMKDGQWLPFPDKEPPHEPGH